jgi:hypothetical protein
MLKSIKKMKSENWGGVASMAGSLITLAAGDAEGAVSTASFVASEVSFARKGHTSWGYSLGCAGISLGDGLLCFSDATAGNPTLQMTMAILTGVWAIGALRYPIEQIGKVVKPYAEGLGNKLQKTANVIPPVVGSLALTLRAPALYTAAFSGEHVNTVMLVCNSLWGTADVLLGRLQDFVKGPVLSFARAADDVTGNCVGVYVLRPMNRLFGRKPTAVAASPDPD